jgi:Gpi18-like mannosyltransferase
MKVSQRPFESGIVVILGFGIFLVMILRFSSFDFESGDYHIYLSPWYDFIVSNGRFSALGFDFSNYSPPYLYLLAMATYLPLPKLYAIKLISVLFDLLLALFVLLIVRLKYKNKVVQMSSFFAALVEPTVFVNSAVWGQADVIYTSMLVPSIYFAIRRRPNLSLFSFSLAFSFKLQAVFLLPLFVVLLLKRRVPTYSFLVIPATYATSVLPAWLAGRPLIELLMTYPAQAGLFSKLTLNAPNLYQWLPEDPERFERPGLTLATLLVGLLCLASWRSATPLDGNVIVKLSLVSALLLPFTLPHMHERYFFAADVASIIYAYYSPKRFFVPLIVSTSSLLSYAPFLFREKPVDLQYLAVLIGIALIVTVADLLKSLYPGGRGGAPAQVLQGRGKRLLTARAGLRDEAGTPHGASTL